MASISFSEKNKQIKKIGIKYIGHFNDAQIVCYFDDCSLTIPKNELRNFVKCFPEYNWENGIFLEDLKGSYVRILISNGSYLVGIKHIVKELVYLSPEYREYKRGKEDGDYKYTTTDSYPKNLVDELAVEEVIED